LNSKGARELSRDCHVLGVEGSVEKAR